MAEPPRERWLEDVMADLGRQGQEWNNVELDAIIADYFAMLGDELARRPYVKAQHRAALIHATGRSTGSIERKHQNISAILVELGLPWIWGYKPLANYQEALYEALDRYLPTRPDLLHRRPGAMKAIADGAEATERSDGVWFGAQQRRRLGLLEGSLAARGNEIGDRIGRYVRVDSGWFPAYSCLRVRTCCSHSRMRQHSSMAR